MDAAIDEMKKPGGYDIIIVCTGNKSLEDEWQRRLDAGKGTVAFKDSAIFAVHEDWEGGAGNGLGTLYAFKKACDKAKEAGKDLEKMLADGKSMALYHTAGKGTRLAPLPGAENNNKPGVKLPSVVKIGEEDCLLTILEAVIIQTSIYAKRAGGRLSVYWGDQVFVPTEAYDSAPTHHADILAQLGPTPNEEEWKANSFDSYGLICVNKDGDAVQVEKVSYAEAKEYCLDKLQPTKVGVSLGSFSVSGAFLTALNEEFSDELGKKQGKFDTDPHWWMPLTLEKAHYEALRKSKGEAKEVADAHWDRMEAFKTKFNTDNKDGPMAKKIFGAVGVGPSTGDKKPYWWDYGQVKFYKDNNTLATADTVEATALRKFLGVESHDEACKAECDKASCIVKASVKKGTVKTSVLAKVTAAEVDVEDSVLVNCTFKGKIKGKGLVLYNVVDESEEGLDFADGAVRADVFGCDGHDKIVMNSTVGTHGGNEWKNVMEGNEHSFEGVHTLNQKVDLRASSEAASKAHAKAAGADTAPPALES